MPEKVDYFVIGAGPAGVCAANILAGSGGKTVIAGKALGGSFCGDGRVVLNSLLHVSSLYDRYKQAMQFFAETPAVPAKIDFKRVKKYVDGVIARVRKAFSDELEENGAEFIEGSVEFIGKNKVLVKKADGSEEIYSFKKCLIASGSSGHKLDILSGAKSLNISTILNFETVPSSVVIIGGGLVGTEAATLFSRIGSRVTVVEKTDRILGGVDHTIVKKYEDALKKKDIEIITGRTVQKIERIGQKYVILFEDGKLESEEVFVCIGRTPLIEGLNLENAGVFAEKGALRYYPDLKTDNPDIYLAGDVTGIRMHSGGAFHSAAIAAKNMLGSDVKYNSEAAPTILSADPEITCVGLTEEEAKKAGYECGVVKYTFGDMYKAAMPSVPPLFAKVVYNKADRTFLGLHAIGRMAMDLVSAFSIVIQAGVTVDKAVDFIYTSPVFRELISELAEKIK